MCLIGGFTESPVAIKMRLETEMGWAITEEEVDAEDVEDCLDD